jgi:hypothetical protein
MLAIENTGIKKIHQTLLEPRNGGFGRLLRLHGDIQLVLGRGQWRYLRGYHYEADVHLFGYGWSWFELIETLQ